MSNVSYEIKLMSQLFWNFFFSPLPPTFLFSWCFELTVFELKVSYVFLCFETSFDQKIKFIVFSS
uniref:Uncharacterized protein n=1 Tax=Solanum lycopersicum TaxID=4081 RepID=A0A3Q7GVK2_SOLLC